MRKAVHVETPYNPLDKKNLGKSVAEALLERSPSPLPPEPFVGAGVYAIYYIGDYAAYASIAGLEDADRLKPPIYVGKAVPPGSRKGGVGLGNDPKKVLSGRLREHATSIKRASNLELSDFYCRYLVVEDIWIPLGESLLIEMFSPIWNRVIDGFGIHQPGKGRLEQERSQWDVLHPGRHWLESQGQSNKTQEDILENLRRFLAHEDAETIDPGSEENGEDTA